MLTAILLASSLDICISAAQNQIDIDRATQACAAVYTKNKSEQAAWELYKLYVKKNDTATANFWLDKVENLSEANKIRAKAFEDRKLIFDAAFWWGKAGGENNICHAAKLCLDAGCEIPKNILDELKKLNSGEALWLKGRIAGKDKEALKLFQESYNKKYQEALYWQEWLEGKIPTVINKQLLLAIANDIETQKNDELSYAVIRKAIELKMPLILQNFALKLESLPEKEQLQAYHLLSSFPEYAKKYALKQKDLGNLDEAKIFMHQAAILGDSEAIFFEAMKSEPTDLEGSREKARILSKILFTNEPVASEIRRQSAKWLAYFFINSDLKVAEEMAVRAKFKPAETMLFADQMMRNGAIELAKKYLIQTEGSADPSLNYQIALRWKSLNDNDKYRANLLKAAEGGVAQALFDLGNLELLEGNSTGIYRISAAADRNIPEALFKRAQFGREKKIPLSDKQIVQDLILALAANYSEAGVELSKMAAIGEHMPINPEESAKYAHLSAKAGSPEGMRIFGIYALKGYGMKANKKLALEWLQKAASLGDTEAANICREENSSFINRKLF